MSGTEPPDDAAHRLLIARTGALIQWIYWRSNPPVLPNGERIILPPSPPELWERHNAE